MRKVSQVATVSDLTTGTMPKLPVQAVQRTQALISMLKRTTI
jgi:hypothetical protein